MKLVFHAIWLAIVGIGCVVSALAIALWLDRAIYRKGLRYE